MKDIKHVKHKHKHTHSNNFLNHLIDMAPGTTIKYEGDVHNDIKAADSSMLSPGGLDVAKNQVYVKPDDNKVSKPNKADNLTPQNIDEKKQEKTNWKSNLESAGELASGGLFLKNLLGRSAPATRIIPFEGPAVGMPFNGVVPNAAQAFRGLVEGGEAAGVIGAEELTAGAIGATAAEAIGGASLLNPVVGLGVAALAAGSGLYYYAKKHLDENPDDRRGKILIDNMTIRQNRAENLTNSMFDDV